MKEGAFLATRKNLRVRQAISDSRLLYWEVSDELRISPQTFSTWLRHQLPEERERKILAAIDKLNRRNAKREAVMTDA